MRLYGRSKDIPGAIILDVDDPAAEDALHLPHVEGEPPVILTRDGRAVSEKLLKDAGQVETFGCRPRDLTCRAEGFVEECVRARRKPERPLRELDRRRRWCRHPDRRDDDRRRWESRLWLGSRGRFGCRLDKAGGGDLVLELTVGEGLPTLDPVPGIVLREDREQGDGVRVVQALEIVGPNPQLHHEDAEDALQLGGAVLREADIEHVVVEGLELPLDVELPVEDRPEVFRELKVAAISDRLQDRNPGLDLLRRVADGKAGQGRPGRHHRPC